MNFNEEDLKNLTKEYKDNQVEINLIQEEIQKLQEKCSPFIKRNSEIESAIDTIMKAENLDDTSTAYAKISYTKSVATFIPEDFTEYSKLDVSLWNTTTTVKTSISKNDVKKYIQESEENKEKLAALGIVLVENKTLKIK